MAAGNLCIWGLVVAGEHVGHRRGELVDVPVGVNVAGRLDGGMAEQLLDGLEVAGGVEHALAGGVARLVHALAAGGALGNDAGSGELAIPPRVPDTRFGVFLSHSSEDARVIAGVKALLKQEGLSVYVDWLEDPQLDRSRVNAATAGLLRVRMNHSGYLLYASSNSSPTSKWMPWELGYFDGRRPGHVGILPIVANPGDSFRGVEYLGLYPVIERVSFERGGTLFAHRTSATTADSVRTMARS